MRTVQKLVKIAQEFKQIYIYGYGLSGKWLTEELKKTGLPVIGFIDTDEKKRGFSFHGTMVKTPKEAYREIQESGLKKGENLIINTVVDIQDVWDNLSSSDLFEVTALGIYLENIQANAIEEAGKDYVEYSLDAVKASHTSFFKHGFRFVRSIDLQVTERCTMKCQDCSNLMQYYEKPVNVTYSKLCQDIENILTRIDKLFEIRLIGGEPFVHPEIYSLLEMYTNTNKIDYVTLFTNSTIKLDRERLDNGKINLKKISFSITNYGGKNARNIEFNQNMLDNLGVKYRIHEPEWWTDSGRILETSHTEETAQKLFEKCCGKNLFTVYDGKLYRCPFASNADSLKAIPYNTQNFVSVESTAESIEEYMNADTFIPACQYCKGRSWDSPIINAAIQTRQPLKYTKKQ